MSGPRNAPHLLRVDDPPERFAALFAAARAEGLRVGWLDLTAASSEPRPQPLEAACVLGALRAVATGGDRTVAVKPIKGTPVLRDLLREHFRGCALVLIRGASLPLEPPEIAVLRAAGEGWAVTAAGEAARAFTSAALAAALRRPRPWGPPLTPPATPPPDRPPQRRERGARTRKPKPRPGGG